MDWESDTPSCPLLSEEKPGLNTLRPGFFAAKARVRSCAHTDREMSAPPTC